MADLRHTLLRDEVRRVVVASFIVGVVVGGTTGWLLKGARLSEGHVTSPAASEEVRRGEGVERATTSPSTPPSRIVLDAWVDVGDQPAGDRVRVRNFSLPPEGGWLVVHEVAPDGSFLNALGAHRYDASVHQGVVELLRGTVAGHTYAVVLYQDNGDRRFSLRDDHPFIHAQRNEPIYDLFVALPPRGQAHSE